MENLVPAPFWEALLECVPSCFLDRLDLSDHGDPIRKDNDFPSLRPIDFLKQQFQVESKVMGIENFDCLAFLRHSLFPDDRRVNLTALQPLLDNGKDRVPDLLPVIRRMEILDSQSLLHQIILEVSQCPVCTKRPFLRNTAKDEIGSTTPGKIKVPGFIQEYVEGAFHGEVQAQA